MPQGGLADPLCCCAALDSRDSSLGTRLDAYSRVLLDPSAQLALLAPRLGSMRLASSDRVQLDPLFQLALLAPRLVRLAGCWDRSVFQS